MKYKINRETFYDEKVNRIDVLDSRYYFHSDNPKVFYPSCTTILEAYPKGWALTQWHKALGFNADIVLERAGKTGSNVHDGCFKYVTGERLEFGKLVDNVFVHNYTLEEWEMICKFVEFWTKHNPRLIAAEVIMLSDTMKLGFTIDLVVEMMNNDGQFENWIIDTKTSNAIHPQQELQLAAYATGWNEQNPDHFISRCGIMHLKASTRGEDKKGIKIQGAGWNLVEFPRHYADAYKVFKALRTVWDNENPTYEPETYSLPGVLELKKTA